MGTFSIVLLVVLAGLVMYVIGLYNTLQQLKTQITAAIQEIGNQLKRQASLIPNLMESVKSYLKHESGIYDKLTAARTSATKASQTNSPADLDKAISSMQSLIPDIKVLVESNPELQANSTVMKFMDELTDTSDKLMYSRRTVIDLTQMFNEKLVMFPSNLIAGMFGFKAEKGLEMPTEGEHLTVSHDETKDVKVDL
jgi:LemA protein